MTDMLVHKLITKLMVILALLTLGDCIYAQDREFTRLERELEYLMTIWPGEYDNFEQLRFDRDSGRTETDLGERTRVHRHVTRVDFPAIGPHVLYLEEYKHNDPQQIFRQRLFELSVDEENQAIRVKLHFLKNAKELIGTHQDVSRLSGLTQENTFLAERACDVLLRRDENDIDVFSGGIQGKKCVLRHGSEGPRYSDFQVKIMPSQQWFRYQTLDLETDERVTAEYNFGWHKLERARSFVCMVDVPKESGGAPKVTHAYARLHDQGGDYNFTHPDGRQLNIFLRNYWSYEMQRETLLLAAQEQNGSSLGYSWADQTAKNIGLSVPNALRLQCDLDTPKNRMLQKNVRPDS